MRNVCSLFLAMSVLCFLPTTAAEAQLFYPSVEYGVGEIPYYVAISDFNGDDNPDLAVADFGDDTVSVLLGNGDGTFQASLSYGAGYFPVSVVSDDLDGDGNPDLAVGNWLYEISVLLGNGDGTFQAAVNYDTGIAGIVYCVAIGDLDGDDNPDLAVAITSNTVSIVSVLQGNGDGTFQEALFFWVGNGPRSIAIGDLDGDSHPDLAVANSDDDTVSVLLGNGNGTFQYAVAYGIGNGPNNVAIGDLDGDGSLDLAVTNWYDEDVSVLLGHGDGTFQPAVAYGVGGGPRSVAIADLDGDNKLDLAVANISEDAVSILLGLGDGTFQTPVNYGVGDYPRRVAIGDLDGDSDLDLAVANRESDNVSVLINTTVPITVSAEMKCVPQIGMLPFSTQMEVTLENLYTGQTRWFAARIDVTTGDGHIFTNWRAGYIIVPTAYSYVTTWNLNLPAHEFLVGPNRFDLVAEDVTPAPFNQPPYPPSGANDMTYCTVTGIMP